MAMSNKLSVAVHILSLIEMSTPEEMTSDYIASSVGTNPVVVRRLMSQLKKAGFIHTKRGSTEGYLLKKPEEISLLMIYKTVEPEAEPFSIHQHPNPQCSVGKNIQAVLENEYQSVQKKMELELDSITLADIIGEIEHRNVV